MCDYSIELLGSPGKECAVSGQGGLPECACWRDKGREPAEPERERACMMWYRAVAHVSLYFFCPSSCSSPPTRGRTSTPPSIRPKSSPPSGGITRVSHYPQRPSASVRASVRPFEARPADRGGRGGGGAPTLAASVRLHAVWLRRHHFVFSVLRKGIAPIAAKRVSNDYPNDSKLTRGLKKLGWAWHRYKAAKFLPKCQHSLSKLSCCLARKREIHTL